MASTLHILLKHIGAPGDVTERVENSAKSVTTCGAEHLFQPQANKVANKGILPCLSSPLNHRVARESVSAENCRGFLGQQGRVPLLDVDVECSKKKEINLELKSWADATISESLAGVAN